VTFVISVNQPYVLRGSSTWGTCRRDSFTVVPRRYVVKAQVAGTSLYIGDPLRNMEGGSFPRDFERRAKGALEVDRFFL